MPDYIEYDQETDTYYGVDYDDYEMPTPEEYYEAEVVSEDEDPMSVIPF
jgi:hypothetical protein